MRDFGRTILIMATTVAFWAAIAGTIVFVASPPAECFVCVGPCSSSDECTPGCGCLIDFSGMGSCEPMGVD